MNKEITVVKNSCSYSELLLLVDYVVGNCFGKVDGEYHEYLKDFYIALVLLTNFTDYKSELKDNELVDEVMDIAFSSDWERICSEIKIYDKLLAYVRHEIKNKTRPLARVEELIKNGNKFFTTVIEKLTDLNVDDLAKAIDSINENVAEQATQQKIDNIENVKNITDYIDK